MSRRGRPSRRAIASGATASGGDTIAPSTKPTRTRHAEQTVHRGRHRAGGEDDAAEREQRDRAQVEAELAPAHRHAGRIDQRRQDAEQHQLGRQLDARQAGNERKPDAGEQRAEWKARC